MGVAGCGRAGRLVADDVDGAEDPVPVGRAVDAVPRVAGQLLQRAAGIVAVKAGFGRLRK